MSPFEAFPLYLKPSHIIDATQFGQTKVHQLIRELEKEVPGSVHRSGRKSTRIHRDTFFTWFATKQGIRIEVPA